jgi:hypothetical protein
MRADALAAEPTDSPMAARAKKADDSRSGAADKLMQTFRMPRALVAFLKAEASRNGRDLTSHVVRWLDGVRTDFGLPRAATALLEADREALGMGRYEYLLHALYQRSLLLRDKGVGFDAPRSTEADKR